MNASLPGERAGALPTVSCKNAPALAIPALSASSIESYIKTVGGIPVLEAEQEMDLALRACRRQDRAAAQTLVLSNLRFVVFVARGYAGYGLPLCDLIQEGNIGLIKALKRFDPAVGVRLISFAVHWIKAEIHEFILRNWRIVRLGTTRAQRRLFFNLRKSRSSIGWMSRPEAEAIALQLRVKTEEVLEMNARMQGADLAIGSRPGGGCLPEGQIEDPHSAVASFEEAQWIERERPRIRKALDRLDPRSRDIVEQRWLRSGQPAALEELGARHQVSAERIRQIQNRALRSLRGCLEPEAAAEPA
jgi:RNA polymerase sigma-32 factor